MDPIKTLIYVLLACLISAICGTAHAKVWEATHHWSDPYKIDPKTGAVVTYEDAYSDWIKEDVDVNIFAASNSLYKGALDCAENVYMLRAQFAFTHSLPFRAAGGLVSNESNQFDNIPAGPQRFVAFAKNMIAHVNTSTLSQDTCPVEAIDRDHVREGTIILSLPTKNEDGGYSENHSLVIKAVDIDGGLTLINGSMVNRNDKASLKNARLAQMHELIFHPHKESKKDGLRRWRHIGESSCPLPRNPLLDQFSDAFPDDSVQFVNALIDHLRITGQGLDEKITSRAESVCEYAKMRIQKVTDTLIFKNSHPGYISREKNASLYDDYSTPNRDAFLREKMRALEDLLCEAKSGRSSAQFDHVEQDASGSLHLLCSTYDPIEPSNDAEVDPDSQEGHFREARELKDDIFRGCPLSYGNGDNQVIALEDFEKLLLNDENPRDDGICHVISSNPNDSLDARWGLGQSSCSEGSIASTNTTHRSQ